MNIQQLLQHQALKELGLKRGVTCFYGKEYPFLFFKLLFAAIERNSDDDIRFCYLFKYTDKSLDEIKQVVGQQVLGQSLLYWLGDIDQMFKAAKMTAVIDFLASYHGPHHLMFFTRTTLPLPENIHTTLIPSDLSMEDVVMMLEALGTKPAAKKVLTSLQHPTQGRRVSLEVVCQSYQAALLLSQQNCSYYVTTTLQADGSPQLYQLIDYFFSRRSKEFFYTWSKIQGDYTTPFWTMFWSDTLWRAYTVIMSLEKKNFSGAKQASSRLPTAFLSTYSKHFSVSYLASLHKIAYAVDCAMKQGSELFIDILFAVHFFTDNHLKR